MLVNNIVPAFSLLACCQWWRPPPLPSKVPQGASGAGGGHDFRSSRAGRPAAESGRAHTRAPLSPPKISELMSSKFFGNSAVESDPMDLRVSTVQAEGEQGLGAGFRSGGVRLL